MIAKNTKVLKFIEMELQMYQKLVLLLLFVKINLEFGVLTKSIKFFIYKGDLGLSITPCENELQKGFNQ